MASNPNKKSRQDSVIGLVEDSTAANREVADYHAKIASEPLSPTQIVHLEEASKANKRQHGYLLILRGLISKRSGKD